MNKHLRFIRKNFLLLWALILLPAFINAQNVSTEGTDFWLGFMPHSTGFLGGTELSIFISTSQDTVTGTISVTGSGVIHNFTLGANSAASLEYLIPAFFQNQVTSSSLNSVDNRSIHIETDRPVSVYALNKAGQFSADATIVLPTPTLGKSYFATCHREESLPSEIVIIGVEDDTDIDIRPTANLIGGVSAGNTTTITLDRGETYLIQSNGDLTGTKITTSNSTDGDCKNFSVFSGVDRTSVGDCSPGLDHLFQNSYPVKTWGQNFTIVPFQDRSGDLIKIVASEDNTTISIPGRFPFSLDEGESEEITLEPVVISTVTADKPISVTQFSRSASCDGGVFGDPFMITLSPNEQLLRRITFTAFPVFSAGFTYYVDIISPTDGKNTVKLTDGTGADIPLNFTDIASNGFSYTQVTLSLTGEHFITSDSGFIANVYGFGDTPNEFESFGYTTGASLNNLNFSIVSIDTGQIFNDDTETLCLGNFISFSPEIDPSFQFFEWDMGDGTTYSTPTVNHVYKEPGIYNVVVNAFTALGDCGSEQTAVKTVEVKRANFNIKGPASVCPNTEAIEYTVLDPNGDYDYVWTLGGGTLISGQNEDTLSIEWGPPNLLSHLAPIVFVMLISPKDMRPFLRQEMPTSGL